MGASVRWSIVVNSKKQLEAALQGLSCPQKYLKPALRQDNVASVWLAKVDILCDVGDGVLWSGHVPILFSPDQVATQHVYRSNPNLARLELNKVLTRSYTWSTSPPARSTSTSGSPTPHQLGSFLKQRSRTAPSQEDPDQHRPQRSQL